MLQHLTTGEPAGAFRGSGAGTAFRTSPSRARRPARRAGPSAEAVAPAPWPFGCRDGVSRRWRSALGFLEQCGAGGEDAWHVTHNTHSESRVPRAEHKPSPRHTQVKSSWFSKTNHLNYDISPSELRFVRGQLYV